MRIIRSTNINFLGLAKFAFMISLLLISGSIYVWFSQGEDKYGIDYKGGHSILVAAPEEANSDAIRMALAAEGMTGAIVQSFEIGSDEYSIRLPGDVQDASIIRRNVTSAMQELYGEEFQILQTDFVGPTIGQELRRAAFIAIIIALIGLLSYISFRFDFAFALGAVAALFHDVIIAMGLYLVAGFTINVATLAAALTIVGYSVNDTIVVFDRMREEMQKRKTFELGELMNYALNATLSRTIITSLLTFFAAMSLFIFGGGAIADLSFFLAVGVVIGTYSTIFIASPVALMWEKFRAAKAED